MWTPDKESVKTLTGEELVGFLIIDPPNGKLYRDEAKRRADDNPKWKKVIDAATKRMYEPPPTNHKGPDIRPLMNTACVENTKSLGELCKTIKGTVWDRVDKLMEKTPQQVDDVLAEMI